MPSLLSHSFIKIFTDTPSVPATFLGAKDAVRANTGETSLFSGVYIRRWGLPGPGTPTQTRQVGEQGSGPVIRRNMKALSLQGPKPRLRLGVNQACTVRDVGPLRRFKDLSVKGKHDYRRRPRMGIWGVRQLAVFKPC